MTLIMVLIIYIGSLCLLSCYNFFKVGHFWRSNYSALNRKWFFLYSLIIEGVVLILLPHIRYLFNEPYVNTTLGTIVFVFILIICILLHNLLVLNVYLILVFHLLWDI